MACIPSDFAGCGNVPYVDKKGGGDYAITKRAWIHNS